jgi:hypothetical protein
MFRKTKIAIVLASTVVITACGGGGGTKPSENISWGMVFMTNGN